MSRKTAFGHDDEAMSESVNAVSLTPVMSYEAVKQALVKLCDLAQDVDQLDSVLATKMTEALGVLCGKQHRLGLHRLASELGCMALALPENGAYLIRYEDASVADDFFAMEGARDTALAHFEHISDNWNASLFVKIKTNYLGNEAPDAHTTSQL